MLNQNILNSEINKELKEFVAPADLIITEIKATLDGPRSFGITSIKNNSKLLGKLHHALNIDQYKKSKFRKNLLMHAKPADLRSYLQKTQLISPTQTTLGGVKEFEDYCEKASKLEWGNNDETKHFVKVFGYDESLIPQDEVVKQTIEDVTVAKRDPVTDTVTLTVYDTKPFRELYFFQNKIFYEAEELVENRYMRFIIQMPTGSGKTRTALEIATHFLNRENDEDEQRQVIWLAESNELNEQAIESFKRIWPYLGKKDIKLYRVWGKYTPNTIENNSFVVAGIAKLTNLLNNNPSSINPGLIICDEAHHAIAPTWKALINKLSEANGVRVIGLTATPVRGLDTAENDELIEFFQGNDHILDIDPMDSDTAIQYLQSKGYLAYISNDTQNDKIKSEEPLTIPTSVLRAASKAKELPEDFLTILAEDHKRNIAIAKKLLGLGKAKKRTLYFGTNRFQAKLMCAVLISFDIDAAYVDGETPMEYRLDVIKKFKSGDIDIICNCDLFTTGFEPKIEVVVIGRPTKSIVLHQQMIGRGMRGPKMGGTPSFELYEMDDGLEGYGIDLADHYFTQQWETSER